MKEFKAGSITPRKIFEDHSQIRYRVFWALFFIILIFIVVLLADFLIRLSRFPPPAALNGNAVVTRDATLSESSTATILMHDTGGSDCTGIALSGQRSNLAGYIPYGDQTALSALRARCGALGRVYYDAYVIRSPEGRVQPLGEDQLTDIHTLRHPATYPIVAIASGMTAPQLERVFSNQTEQFSLVSQLQALQVTQTSGGVCLNLAHYPEMNPDVLLNVYQKLADWLGPQGLETCLIGPLDAAFWGAADLMAVVDRAVVQGFRRSDNASTPDFLMPWFAQGLETVQNVADPGDLSFALGAFSTSWRSGRQLPERLSYAAAMEMAHRFDAPIGYLAEAGVFSLRFVDNARRITQIWVQDAVTLHNQLSLLPPDAEVTLWPLGYEDPSVWGMLDERQDPWAALEAPIDLSGHAVLQGEGPFVTFASVPVAGQRMIGRTPDGLRPEYTEIPRPNILQRYGHGDVPAVSIAFIGFPNQTDLDALLSILHQRDISAVFFASSIDLFRVERSLVRQILSEGHLVGNLTSDSSFESGLWSNYVQVFSNLPQQLLAHQHGLRSRFVLIQPETEIGLAPPRYLQHLKYLDMGDYVPVVDIVSVPRGRYGAQNEIVPSAIIGARQNAHLVAFSFDLWGGRSLILQLPGLLESFEQQGYAFASLPDLAKILPNLAVQDATQRSSPADKVIYAIFTAVNFAIENALVILAVAVLMRMVILLFLSALRREKFPLDPTYTPPVTVIIPAFNEEKVIEGAVSSALACEYPDVRIIVVNDGSTDKTAAVVRRAFSNDPRVTLINEENNGKWFAENNAVVRVTTPIFVIVDADTLLHRDALTYLVQPFRDPRTGAVAGQVEVGNRENFLTACQAVEYKISQSVIRRAYEVIRGILVVPGAIGAWRKSAVIDAEMVSGETITEDADLTFAMHRAGYRVVYAPNARSYTEVPTTFRNLFRQRLRWFLGLLQVTWKHKRSVLEGHSVGYISFFDTIWHRMLVSFVLPVFDMIIVIGVGRWVYLAVIQGIVTPDEQTWSVLMIIAMLTALDVPMILAAFWYEKKFELRLLLVTPLARFGFRQVLYIAAIRSLYLAVVGKLSRWNKLSRSGRATIRHD